MMLFLFICVFGNALIAVSMAADKNWKAAQAWSLAAVWVIVAIILLSHHA